MSKRRTKSEMFPLMASWESGNQDRKQFCRAHKMPSSTFSYWRAQYLKSQQTPDIFFSRIHPEASDSIEVLYPNGVKISLRTPFDPLMVKSLIGLYV